MTINILPLDSMFRSPLQNKEVLPNEMNTRIDCDVRNSSAVNVTWSFNGIHLPNSFVESVEECNTSTGIFQLRHRPSSLIICKLNQTVHSGQYACHARSQNKSESRDMELKILGKIPLTCLCVCVSV